MDPNLPKTPKLQFPFVNRFGPVGIILLGAVVFLLILFLLNYFNIIKTFDLLPKPPLSEKPAGRVIAKVGKELIYQSDLDVEIANMIPIPDFDLPKYLLNKIATDSAILQSAQAEGIISLDETVFNSPNKNYMTRVNLVVDIKNQIDQKSDHIKGAVVSIFFINNLDSKPGPLGYEKSKQIAFDTLSALQKRVKSREITIDQAGEDIRKNTSLKDLDYSYEINSIFRFSSNKGERITLDENIDQALWNLKEGEVSEVFAASFPDFEGKVREGVYMFGQVFKKNSSIISSLDQWIQDQVKKYEVIYY